MNQDNNLSNEVLNFQLQRVFASLGRNILVLLEDLRAYHSNNFDKLYDNLPPEQHSIIDLANYFDHNTYQHYRGKVLNAVNSARRDLEFLTNENIKKD